MRNADPPPIRPDDRWLLQVAMLLDQDGVTEADVLGELRRHLTPAELAWFDRPLAVREAATIGRAIRAERARERPPFARGRDPEGAPDD